MLPLLFALALQAAALPVVEAPRIVEAVDRISDERSVFLTFKQTSKKYLAIGCRKEGDASSIQVIIGLDEYIGDARPGYLAGGREIEFRFDQAAPQKVWWFSDDHSVYAVMNDTKPLAFIRKIKGTTALYLRTLTNAGREVSLDLRYPESSQEIDTLLTRCGYRAR